MVFLALLQLDHISSSSIVQLIVKLLRSLHYKLRPFSFIDTLLLSSANIISSIKLCAKSPFILTKTIVTFPIHSSHLCHNNVAIKHTLTLRSRRLANSESFEQVISRSIATRIIAKMASLTSHLCDALRPLKMPIYWLNNKTKKRSTNTCAENPREELLREFLFPI